MICPTPSCGYRLEGLYRKSCENFPCAFECPSCAAIYLLQPAGVDEDGPHGERLLPVLDEPPSPGGGKVGA